MMNCRTAQKQAALFAGGDLPERDIPNLMKHLESCGECAEELESLKRARTIVKEIAQADIPDALPADFSQSVMNRITDNRVSRPQRAFNIIDIFRNHPAAVFAAAACIVILYLGVSHIMLQRKVQRFAQRLEEVQEMVQRDRAEIELSGDFLSARSIDGPFPLDDWEQQDTPGIFAVLHKPDPENRPDTYTIDYMGDTGSGEIDYAAWVDLNRGHFLTRAGSSDNIYVAVYRMPDSSESYRLRIAGYFIHKHKPYFNNGV
ncbi:anti-sigma factor family protein [Candidatus Latescibacterota bacterium]